MAHSVIYHNLSCCCCCVGLRHGSTESVSLRNFLNHLIFYCFAAHFIDTVVVTKIVCLTDLTISYQESTGIPCFYFIISYTSLIILAG